MYGVAAVDMEVCDKFIQYDPVTVQYVFWEPHCVLFSNDNVVKF